MGKIRKRKKLGLLGGLGPMAGIYLAERVTDMTDARTDQDHLEIVLYSDPAVPDRTAFMLGESADSPLPKLREGLRFLEDAGCANIAIACVTAHYFGDELGRGLTSASLLNMLELTADKLVGLGIRRAGLTATSGTVSTGIFQKSLESRGIECIIPSPGDQAWVMDEIYSMVKAGNFSDGKTLADVASRLAERGAECVILGCTELSIVKRDVGRMKGNAFEAPGVPGIIDALDVLAEAAVLASDAKLKSLVEK
ncbi:MAG: amino acid racemase [Clostridiales Family XIII bacterium]|nr:amino acid racemase [Clostridiales Family XIII bacterium]